MLLQIFEFLDVNGLGSIDLVAIMGSAPDWLDDLDDEVRWHNTPHSSQQGSPIGTQAEMALPWPLFVA